MPSDYCRFVIYDENTRQALYEKTLKELFSYSKSAMLAIYRDSKIKIEFEKRSYSLNELQTII